MTDRRKFLRVGALLIAAPAVIRTIQLMPIKVPRLIRSSLSEYDYRTFIATDDMHITGIHNGQLLMLPEPVTVVRGQNYEVGIEISYNGVTTGFVRAVL